MISYQIKSPRTKWPRDDKQYAEYSYFSIEKDFHHLFLKNNASNILIFAKNELFIAHKNLINKDLIMGLVDENLCLIDRKSCQYFNNPLLDKHQLIAGKVSVKRILEKSDERELNQFKNTLIDFQIKWSKRFLKLIHDHLRSRHAEGGVLLNQGSIQLMLGEVIGHLESAVALKQYMKDAVVDYDDGTQILMMQEIKKANHILAKLAGGRAFLHGNVVEMILVFEFFQDIYFA